MKTDACDACALIDADGSAFCLDHQRAQIVDGCEQPLADLIAATAAFHCVRLTDRRTPKTASITVDAVEVNGDRVVRIVLPAGAQSVALVLAPAVALQLARTIADQARKAQSPAGLILPG